MTALPAERRFHVATDAPAYLVFAETWYPGWSATVNGAPAPLLRANLAFQAVAVPAGDSEIVFRYRITHFEWGVVIAGGALIAALALLLGERIRQSRAG
ncbi:MAG: YfhO family protein [Anaerolineae bacterium]|nr:YfhO family protein [Anaerolineae bacterium]